METDQKSDELGIAHDIVKSWYRETLVAVTVVSECTILSRFMASKPFDSIHEICSV